MKESLFQDQFRREARVHGWVSRHLSPPSERGFPDLVLWKGYSSLLVEMKVVSSFESKSLLISLFTDGQFPWMINWLDDGGMPVFIAVSDRDCQGAWLKLSTPEEVYVASTKSVRETPFQASETAESLFLDILRASGQR